MQLLGLQEPQLQKAVASLLKYIGKQKEETKQLIDDDELIYLIIQLKKIPQQKRKDKPERIAVPHALHTVEGADVCLIVKDHKGEGHTSAKQRLQKLEKNGGVAKVLGVSKLKTKYESHEAKRQLCGLYDIFLADERILPSLPKLIGKAFFKKKKQPIPINLRTKDLPQQIRDACESTYLFWSGGSCLSIKVAKSSFSAEDVAENVTAVIKAATEHIPKKWSNVQSVFIKTADSVALPIYQCMPEQPLRIAA
jgi:ribosome biogenesis protein UTP30